MMRFSNKTKTRIEMEQYDGDRLRREIEKAIKDGHIYGAPIKKGKRYRSAFTTEQVKYLEKEFCKYPYIGNARRKDVANVLDIPERAVKIWFQNRRMKLKKDVPNKETDGDKSSEVSKFLSSLQSTNDESLPLLPTIASPVQIEVKLNTVSDSNRANGNTFEDLSLQGKAFETNKEYSIVVKKASSLTTTPAETSISLIKNNVTDNSYSFVDDKSTITKVNQARHYSPINQAKYTQVEYQKLDYLPPPSLSPPAVPQDLSSKSIAQPQVTQSTQKSPDAKFNSEDVPLYLKDYYAPSYLPPGHMIWNPLMASPVIASSPISPITLAGPESALPNSSIGNKNCTCDCHKTYALPMMLQNNPSPNVQYVLSAVPFPSFNSKY